MGVEDRPGVAYAIVGPIAAANVDVDNPNTFVDLLDADALTSGRLRWIDPLAVHANAPASGDDHRAVMQCVCGSKGIPQRVWTVPGGHDQATKPSVTKLDVHGADSSSAVS